MFAWFLRRIFAPFGSTAATAGGGVCAAADCRPRVTAAAAAPPRVTATAAAEVC